MEGFEQLLWRQEPLHLLVPWPAEKWPRLQVPGVTVNSSVPAALLGTTERFRAELSRGGEGDGTQIDVWKDPALPRLSPEALAQSVCPSCPLLLGGEAEGRANFACACGMFAGTALANLCVHGSVYRTVRLPSPTVPMDSASRAADMLSSVAVTGVWERKAFSPVATC